MSAGFGPHLDDPDPLELGSRWVSKLRDKPGAIRSETVVSGE